jgi:hypothetical protein
MEQHAGLLAIQKVDLFAIATLLSSQQDCRPTRMSGEICCIEWEDKIADSGVGHCTDAKSSTERGFSIFET